MKPRFDHRSDRFVGSASSVDMPRRAARMKFDLPGAGRQYGRVSMRRLGCIAALIALSACTLGPDYRRPDLPVPVQWRSSGAAQGQGQSVTQPPSSDQAVMDAWSLAPWWLRLNDPLLNEIIDAALTRNRDVAIATEKVMQARAAFRVSGAPRWPSLSARGNATRQQQPPMALMNQGLGNANGGQSSPLGGFGSGPISLLQAGLDASWELDLFGGNRRAAEASRYGLDAAQWQYRATMLTLVGDVVHYYTQARRAQQQHAIERDNARTLASLLRMTRARFEAGSASRLDSVRFDADLQAAQARIVAQAVFYRQAEHALSMLTGDAPGTWLPSLRGPDLASRTVATPLSSAPSERLLHAASGMSSNTASASAATLQEERHAEKRGADASDPPSDSDPGLARYTPLSIPVDIAVPSAVLLMRPDLQVAERAYAQATARLGVAEAERLPKVSLVGGLYSVGMKAGDLSKRSSIGWAIGPQLSLPLFTGGRLRAAVDEAKSLRQQAFLTYEGAVLSALREVEDALVGLTGAVAEVEASEAAERRYDEAARLASARYLAGADPQDATLIAARDLAAARTRLADSRAAVMLAYVGLQKALGGGWDGRAAKQGVISNDIP
ncbi:TolC family protein [Robbsia sp. KACC 23696]|uniref:TolC family protein n=1 Tax=Robbsia sp. KACC 23696 TaxID=3149231 RepID=UPI00325AFBEE